MQCTSALTAVSVFLFLNSAYIGRLQAQDYYQQYRAHYKSEAPSSARYEIVQSAYGMRDTYRIDKSRGRVWIMVESKEAKQLSWKEIIRLAHVKDDKRVSTVNVTYQLFVSGTSAKGTYLINTTTGATWHLAEDTETKALFWSPVED